MIGVERLCEENGEMHVLISGSRRCGKVKQMQDLIDSLPEDAVVVVGGAQGADAWAEKMAVERGLTVKVFPADWEQHGKKAGYLRNKQMLEETWPEEVHCFYVKGAENKGTRMMFHLAEQFGTEFGLNIKIEEYLIDPTEGLREIDL